MDQWEVGIRTSYTHRVRGSRNGRRNRGSRSTSMVSRRSLRMGRQNTQRKTLHQKNKSDLFRLHSRYGHAENVHERSPLLVCDRSIGTPTILYRVAKSDPLVSEYSSHHYRTGTVSLCVFRSFLYVVRLPIPSHDAVYSVSARQTL